MFDFFADLLSWLYDLWPSYGGAIILFTLLIMTVMAPVTVRQTKSMLAMQKLQPEIKRLRDKYGDDREQMNQEMMALYQANGVNRLAAVYRYSSRCRCSWCSSGSSEASPVVLPTSASLLAMRPAAME